MSSIPKAPPRCRSRGSPARCRTASATRLERLRGMGARFGRALMCACSRVTLSDDTVGDPGGRDRAGRPAPDARRTRAPAAGRRRRSGRAVLGRRRAAACDAGGDRSGCKARDDARGARRRRVSARTRWPSGHAYGSTQLGDVIGRADRRRCRRVLLVAFRAAEAQAEPAADAPQASPAEPAAPVAEQPAESRPPNNPSPSNPSRTTARQPAAEPTPSADTPSSRRRRPAPPHCAAARTAAGRTAPAAAAVALRLADGRRRPLHARLRRIRRRSSARVTAGALGQPWDEIAAALALDPEGQVARAIASHDTWSGITVAFPVDGSSERLAVELSGLPVFDRERSFRGYRGFGVCRDVARHRRADADAPGRARAAARRAEPPARPSRRRSAKSAPRCRSCRRRRTWCRSAPRRRRTRRRASRRSSTRRSANWRAASPRACATQKTCRAIRCDSKSRLRPRPSPICRKSSRRKS